MSIFLGNLTRNIMQTQQTPRLNASYATFFKDSAEFPEQLKYHRFGDDWAKKLYDDGEQLFMMKKELNDGIADLRSREGGHPLTTLEFPRSLAKRDGRLFGKWMRFEQKLRTYSQDLCLYSSLFKLPDHGPYARMKLRKYTELFENGNFGPTNEINAAAAYQDPTAPDFVAVVGIPSFDILTNLAINKFDWIDKKILERLRKWFKGGADSDGVELQTLVTVMDAITCIFAPILLTATMYALASVKHPKVRIAVVGVFGLIFSASAKFLSGPVPRSSIFSLTAAFYAVASVFVFSTDNTVCKGM